MPAMASITVKKADDVTNIVYDAIAPSAGDTVPAIWRQDTGASAAIPLGHRAMAWLKTLWNGPRTARRVLFEYKRPYSTLNTTTNLYAIADTLVIKIDGIIPQGMPPAEINEGVFQGANLFASALIKQCTAAGYSAT